MTFPSAFILEPASPDLPAQLASLPAASGIYMLSVMGKAPHLSWSANLRRRLTRLLNPAAAAPTSLLGRLQNNLASVECWAAGSRLEASLLMYELAKSHFPADYLKLLRLRMPWFVALASHDPFPRLTLVNRFPRKAAPLFGPFSSRDSALRYQDELLGLFQIRRCADVLAPHPEHPGCIYGEMNQCLRPCQGLVTQEEYVTEFGRVADFLATNGKSSAAVLSSARDRACEVADFEQAALIHKRIEKINAAAAIRDEVITEIRRFNGVALTRGTEARSFRLWPMLQGYWQEPVTLTFRLEESRAKSLDQELREQLAATLNKVNSSGNSLEQLAIFSRWYYSSWRDGDWFPFRDLADLNYRRLVRSISNLAKAEPAGVVR